MKKFLNNYIYNLNVFFKKVAIAISFSSSPNYIFF